MCEHLSLSFSVNQQRVGTVTQHSRGGPGGHLRDLHQVTEGDAAESVITKEGREKGQGQNFWK